MDVFVKMILQIPPLLIIFLISIGILLTRYSEKKTTRILGKVILGIFFAPIVIAILFFLTCVILYLT